MTLLNWGVAAMLKDPIWELTDEEAKKSAESITRLTELYGNIPGMDEKTRAWVRFAGVQGVIYGPRIATVMMNAKKKTKPNVVHMGMHNVG